jgi:hypothetical protein
MPDDAFDCTGEMDDGIIVLLAHPGAIARAGIRR